MDPQLTAEAANHAVRLWLGLEDVSDVMTWADELVANSPAPSMAIMDLSSAFRESRPAVLTRLRALTTREQEISALRIALPDVAQLVRDGAWSPGKAIKCLKAIAWDLKLFGGDIGTEMYVLEDYLEPAAERRLTDADVRQHFFEALERIEKR